MPTTLSPSPASAPTAMQQAANYLLSRPRYCEAGHAMGVSIDSQRFLFRVECVEVELRFYLAGKVSRYDRINRDVRSFLLFEPLAARATIRFSLSAIEMTLLENEWYELMPRYQKVRKHLQRTFGL